LGEGHAGRKTEEGAAEYSAWLERQPLSEGHARDYAVRDFKAHLGATSRR
jgi:hypothetical protein